MFLFVFVGKKIISTDTIMPIILEVKKAQPLTKVFFVTPDEKTHQDLSENKTLYTFISEQCSIFRLGGLQGERAGKLIQSVTWLCVLGLIYLLMSIKKAQIIHFGLIEDKPRNVLGKFPDRIFYFENNGWGTAVYEDEFQAMSYDVKPPRIVKSSAHLVGFNKNWTVASAPGNKNLTKYFLTPSKLWPCWKAYIDEIGPAQWKVECEKFNIPEGQKAFLIVLGTLDGLPSLGMGSGPIDDILIDTINTISMAAPQIPIILKPHAITDKKRLLAIIASAKSQNIHVTYLHPCVLASHILGAICNYYSTSLIDLWHYNVPTIEYTRYSKEGLEITGGGSMRPEYVDHFIEIGKGKELANIIKKYSQASPFKPIAVPEEILLSEDDKKLINTLVS